MVKSCYVITYYGNKPQSKPEYITGLTYCHSLNSNPQNIGPISLICCFKFP